MTTPTPVSNFPTTDTAAYLWFYITGLTSADSIWVDFYASGTEYGQVQFGPPSAAGTCYTVTLPIAPTATTQGAPPGNWTAYIYDGTTQLGYVNFTITGSSSCSYSLSAYSASVAASGGSGSFNVTAGSGCAWSATSSATWLTTSSSGSGNGTVNYTVTANTGTTSRAGTITLGGQTFTVTQAGTGGGGGTPPTVTITEYPVPTAGSEPWGIAAGPDGNLWFTEDGKIGKITTAGVITEYSLPNNKSYANAIVAGPDGALWFAEGGTQKIGRITTSGSLTEYPVAAAPGRLTGIAAGPDGALWFTDTDGNAIGRITTSGIVTEYSVPTANEEPWLIAVGPDGNLWFTEDTKIGRITTAGTVTEYAMPSGNSFPWGIAVGPDGAMWFTEEKGGRIGRITTAGAITEYPVTTTGNDLSGIALGPSSDGALWFSDNGASKIARITTAGAITEYAVPTTGGGLRLLVAGPDGAIWFTEQTRNQIGRVALPGGGATTCTYALSSSSNSVAAAGGSASFNVTAGTGCSWTASSNATWITTTSSGSGNGTVNYTVTANTTTSSRTGTITVGGQTFTVTQAGTSGGGGGGTTSGNLIQNGDAESGPAAANAASVPSIPGWTTDGGAAVVAYTDPSGDLSDWSPPPNFGKNYFSGGTSNSSATMTQTINLSSYASAIDAGTQGYTLDGWLGGWDGQDDNAVLTVTFLSASGATLGTAKIGPVLSADRGGADGLLERTATGTVPSGTRSALISLVFTRVSGTYNDGCADNLSFALTGGGSTATGNFTFPGFGNTAGLSLVGSAATPSTSDGTVLRLTPATGNQSGAAYSTTPVTLGNNATFSTQFQFRFSNQGGTEPADGIVFVLGTSTKGLGGLGVGMGYSGVSGNSVGIEFDTYNNTGFGLGNDDGNSSNHVSIDTNGSLTNTDLTNVYGNGTCVFGTQNPNTAAGCMSNGDLWTVNINYDGAKLTVTLSDPKEGSSFTAINGYPINLASILGQTTAYVGFTSGTGAGFENHDIVNWTFQNTAQTSVTCTYSLSGPSTSVGAAQTTGSVTVTAGSGCAWTVVNSLSWVTITSATSGTGNGTVNYSVAANSGAARSGSFTIGGQTYTVNQAAAVVACSYAISPTSNNMAAQAGSSSISIVVTAGSSCSWTASVSSSASSWLHLGSVTSGTGNGSVNYSVDLNTSTVSRTGTITVAGLTFTVTQAGGASATAPSIAQGGIVNAVSNRGGGIAQGSMFTIYGSNLGPAASWTAYQFPLPDTVNNVIVTVTQGSTTLRAYLLYVQANQINAIMPSNAPLGNVQITVTYNGVIGAASTVNIVKVAFGLNSSAYGPGPGIIQNYNSATDHPFNNASTPAKPNQVEIIVGTGLGPITTPDNQSPPAGAPTTPVQVLVGGIQANMTYSGRAPGNAGQDQINFNVPPNAPLGCYVPLQVNAGGTWSQTVRIAISSDGSPCQDTFNPYSGLSSTGGKSATLGLIRVKFSGQVDPTQPPTSATLDLGLGAFALTNPGTDFTYSPITNLPPPGTCAATNKMLDLGTVMGNGGSTLDPTIAAGLDAGPQLTVTGGAGGATGTLSQSSDMGPNAPYMGLLGGILNVSGATVPPPFLDGGPFTISGPGGKDVGAFSTTVALAPTITWTNPPPTINRSSPLTLTWTGGNSSQVVLIMAGSTDQTSKASGGFVCLAPAAAGTFTVPANALADMIPTGAATSSNGPVGMLGLMPLQPGNMQLTPLPKGLNVGVVFDTTLTVQTVQVQ